MRRHRADATVQCERRDPVVLPQEGDQLRDLPKIRIRDGDIDGDPVDVLTEKFDLANRIPERSAPTGDAVVETAHAVQ